MIFAHDEPLAGRNMKRDALHGDLAAAGCVYQGLFYSAQLNL
jgi:sarcosine dehydrogenase